jgi:hypothetical protein
MSQASCCFPLPDSMSMLHHVMLTSHSFPCSVSLSHTFSLAPLGEGRIHESGQLPDSTSMLPYVMLHLILFSAPSRSFLHIQAGSFE